MLDALCDDVDAPWSLIPSTETTTGTIVLHDRHGVSIADLYTEGPPCPCDELIVIAPTIIKDLVAEVRRLRNPGDPERRLVDELVAAILGVKVEYAERFSVSDALREAARLHGFKREHRRRMSEPHDVPPSEADRRFAKMLVDIYDGGDPDERIAAYTGEVMNLRRQTIESVAAMVERGDAREGHQAEGNPETHDAGPLFALKAAIVERIRDMAGPFTSANPKEKK